MKKRDFFGIRVFKPGALAVHVMFQPVFEFIPSVWKKISTLLLLVFMIGGEKCKEADGSESPQLLSIKVVPSPSVILTKSHGQVETSQA